MEDICLKFGMNVKKYRKLKNMSQEELAELSGLHRTYISAVERGKRSISLNNIQKLANALGIGIYLLFVFND
jgi:transcriptional regulator with XRE-family HTH domain